MKSSVRKFALLALLVVVGVVAFQLSTSTNYPDVELSSSEREQLKSALSRLEAAIKAEAPSIHSELVAGADEDQIARLRSAIGDAKNEPLELWFEWHNGAESPFLSLLPLGSPLSIDRAIEDRNLMRKIPLVPGSRRNSLKILDDFAGDGFFIDLRSETPYVFYEMLEDPGPGYFGTLSEFTNFIASCFEAGVFSADKSGFLEYDEDAYYALEEEFLKSASQP